MRGKKLIAVLLLTMLVVLTSAFTLDINNGDKVVVFNNANIPEGDIITGDAVVVFGNLEVRGVVRGDVVAVFGNVDIYGEAGGDAVAVFGNIDLHDNATVSGDTVGVLGNVSKASGAVIKGESTGTRGKVSNKSFDLIPSMGTSSVIGIIISFIFSWLALIIMPDKVRIMADSCKYRIGRSIGIGVLVFLVTILAIPILMITIIGIIPAIFLILAFIPVAIIGHTAVYLALGQKVAAAVEGKNSEYIQLLIGLVVVSAVEMIPVIGYIAMMTVFFIGLGVAFDTRLGGLFIRKHAA